MQAAGKVRYIGVTGYSLDTLLRLVELLPKGHNREEITRDTNFCLYKWASVKMTLKVIFFVGHFLWLVENCQLMPTSCIKRVLKHILFGKERKEIAQSWGLRCIDIDS